MNLRKTLFVSAALAILLSSCTASKQITYFQDINPGEEIPVMAQIPIRLEPNDKLSIIVNTGDSRLNTLFNLVMPENNMARGTNTSSTNSNAYRTASYTIDNAGDIDFPVLGRLHIAGMTRQEVAEYIRRELISRDLAKNPIVTVEYLNLSVSVLGEVGRPGQYGISREDYTILDALSSAGDLTIFGRRDNIKVIRKENGRQKMYTIDISSGKDLTQSPVYFLRQNDVIYVEPNNTKKMTSTPNGNVWSTPGFWVSMVGSCLSIATLIITLTKD